VNQPTTVQRLRATTTVDRHGDTVDDWTSPDIVDIDGAVWAPIQNPEANELGRQGVVVGWAVYLIDAGVVDVAARDRLRWDGNDYHVDGEPARYRHPFTGRDVVEITTRRVEG